MKCRLRWCVEMETRCRIPIWRTFGRIQWHVIPEPRITLQGAATWWIHCHDSRATCRIAGCSHLAKSMSWSCHIAGCKNSIRHIENRFSPYFTFLFLMQFRLRRAAGFVSSPIHLLHLHYNYYMKHLEASSDCRERGNKRCFCPSVCLSVCPSVAYIANNSRTQRPSVPKFGRRLPTLDAIRIPVSRSSGQRSRLDAGGGIPCRPNPAATLLVASVTHNG